MNTDISTDYEITRNLIRKMYGLTELRMLNALSENKPELAIEAYDILQKTAQQYVTECTKHHFDKFTDLGSKVNGMEGRFGKSATNELREGIELAKEIICEIVPHALYPALDDLTLRERVHKATQMDQKKRILESAPMVSQQEMQQYRTALESEFAALRNSE